MRRLLAAMSLVAAVLIGPMSTARVAAGPPIDLSVLKGHVGTFTLGQQGVYEFDVLNGGPGGSGPISITDDLPAGLQFVGLTNATNPHWSCGADKAGRSVVCNNPFGVGVGVHTFLSGPVGPGDTIITVNSTIGLAVNDHIELGFDEVARITAINGNHLTVARGIAPTNDHIGHYHNGAEPVKKVTKANSLFMTVNVFSDAPSPLVNTASITDGQQWTDTVFPVAPSPGTADLYTFKGGIGSFLPGHIGTFEVDVNNAGPTSSGPITVTDQLPSGLTFFGMNQASDPLWACADPNPPLVQCDRSAGLIAAGKKTTLSAAVDATQTTITVTSASGFAVGDRIQVGDNEVMEITAITGTTFTVIRGVRPTSDLKGHAHANGTKVEKDDTTKGVVFDVKIAPDVTFPIFNTATAGGPLFDPDTSDNSGQTQIGFGPPSPGVADLAIFKGHIGPFTAGHLGVYQFDVNNTGPDTPTAPITLTDALPNGLTFAGIKTGSNPNWTCNGAGTPNVWCTFNAALLPTHAKTNLLTDIDAAQTTIIVGTTTGLAVGDRVQVGQTEVMQITGIDVATNTLDVIRGVAPTGGLTGTAHPKGTKVVKDDSATSLLLNVNVLPWAVGPLTNSGTISSGSTDPDLSDNTGTDLVLQIVQGIVAHPSSVVAETDGGAGGVVQGGGFLPNEVVHVSSPALTSACPIDIYYEAGPGPFGIGSINVTADGRGTFNVAFGGLGCTAPGTYAITASEVNAPFHSATTNFFIDAPGVQPQTFLLMPSVERRTDTTGAVAVALVIGGLPANDSITIKAPSLVAACLSGVEGAERADGFYTIPSTTTTDANGTDIPVLDASGCSPGVYPISITETAGLQRTFTRNFTVTGP